MLTVVNSALKVRHSVYARMLKCTFCSKGFRHRSALSRHTRGNPNQNVRPCKERLMAVQPSAGGPNLRDHLFQETLIIPEDIDIKSVVKADLPTHDVPRTWLEKVHMNPAYPHLWNVVLANVSSRTVMIRSRNTWTYRALDDWAAVFIREVLVYYNKNISPVNHKVLVDMVLNTGEAYERREGVKALEATLNGYMRTVIKKAHRLR